MAVLGASVCLGFVAPRRHQLLPGSQESPDFKLRQSRDPSQLDLLKRALQSKKYYTNERMRPWALRGPAVPTLNVGPPIVGLLATRPAPG